MLRPDRFISTCVSWDEFWEGTKKLSTAEKGSAFERITQLYLQTTPEYLAELESVWTITEVPPAVRKLLDLPLLDEGIDFIARTRHGKYWAIQSKFRSQYDN
jgi:predicted helicase